MARPPDSGTTTAWQWLDANWQYAGVIAGFFYVAILCLVRVQWTLPDLLLWLQLPIYVAHQFEEHIHDRFRLFVNSHLGHGYPALTPRAVTVINVGGVWCLDLAAIALVRSGVQGAAMLAFYLAIVNAVAHILGGLISRSYNPGLATAAILLLPFGVWGAVVYSRAYGVSLLDHVVAIALILALHAAIVFHVLRRRAYLASASSAIEPGV